MKKIPVEQAIGHTLCHDITAMKDGFKGPAFRRGHVVSKEDIPVLLDIGKQSVFVWEEQAGWVHEEDAALRMIEAIRSEHMRTVGPTEGKMQLIAERDGLFRVDTDLLHRLNAIEDVTLATLPDHYPVKEGAALASGRIIPLLTEDAHIEQFEELAGQRALIELHPYQPRVAGVIITGSEVYRGRIQDRFAPLIRAKLEAYPCDVAGVEFCDDDESMILEAMNGFIKKGADLIVLTGGMSVDPDDVTPSAVRKLGAEIVSYGVPAQPGNMTLVAYLGNVAFIGVPGAALHFPTTVFDVLLPAVFAAWRIEKQDLIRLGDGGLCQMCAACHFPNCTFGRY